MSLVRGDPITSWANPCIHFFANNSDPINDINFAKSLDKVSLRKQFPALLPTSLLLQNEDIIWIVTIIATLRPRALATRHGLPGIVSLPVKTLES